MLVLILNDGYTGKVRRNEMTRTELINEILKVQDKAIEKGFDWPTTPVEAHDTKCLRIFVRELNHFFKQVAKPKPKLF